MQEPSPFTDLPVDHDSVPYWSGCLEQRLLIQRCDDCGHWVHFPKGRCPACHSEWLFPTEVDGRGTIYTFVQEHRGQDVRTLALVELPEQTSLRIPAPIVDCDPGTIEIGMPVSLTWIEYGGLPVPAFRPVPDASQSA